MTQPNPPAGYTPAAFPLPPDFPVYTDQDYRRDRIRDAATMLGCPYYRGVGACSTGCYSEPACTVDVPDADGWIGVLIEAEREDPGSVLAAIGEHVDTQR